MKIRDLLLSSTVLAGVAMAGVSAQAADIIRPGQKVVPVLAVPPAVSAVNGKLAVFGGFADPGFESLSLWGVEGALSIPLGMRYGLQIDGRVASLDGEVSGMVAGHLFWRDPRSALLGAFAQWENGVFGSGDSWRIAAEGEAYFGQISVEGLLGWENTTMGDGVFGLVDLAFYPVENLRLAVGYRHWDRRDMAALGAEWLMPVKVASAGTALFAEGRVGTDSYAAAWAGVRFYFGPDKSLVRRHREDDPRVRQEFGAAPIPK